MCIIKLYIHFFIVAWEVLRLGTFYVLKLGTFYSWNVL